MTSFDYLSGGIAWPRGGLRALSPYLGDGTLALCVACAVILVAAWALEAQHLHRAFRREDSLSRAVEVGRLASAQTARRYDRARRMNALIRSLDVEVGSGMEEAKRLTDLANALPQKTWLTAISENDAEYSLEGGAPSLAELGRALGALGGLPRMREAELIEAAPAARGGSPEALRYRMRLVWNSL